MIEIRCRDCAQEQLVKASDHSACLVTNRTASDHHKFYFSFYGNYHPSFWITKPEDDDSLTLTVRTVNRTEQFLITFA
jgi:hypothetical protein